MEEREYMTKMDKKRHKGGAKKKIQDQLVVTHAMMGKKTVEIADELGIARQTVSKILNSEDTKRMLEVNRSRITQLTDKAVNVMEAALDNQYLDGNNALKAALPILKTAGLIKESVDLNHQFPKPLVIQKRDGSQTVVGSEHDKEEDNEN
jgi:DNA-binding MarR family transcriptional regulator